MTVRDELLLFVKVSLMMPIRVMRAFADVTHSLAVAGAVLNRRKLLSAECMHKYRIALSFALSDNFVCRVLT